MKVLIAFTTKEGQTRKVAEQIGSWVIESGHSPRVIDCAVIDSLSFRGYGAYILAGSVHFGRHSAKLVNTVKRNLEYLNTAPTVLISVSGSAASTNDKAQKEAAAYVSRFLEATNWRPTSSLCIGGAILYSKYNLLLRAVMRAIAKKQGEPTDTSLDHELTDWNKLESFIKEFLTENVGKVPSSTAAASNCL